MPATLTWFHQPRVIHERFFDKVTLADISAMSVDADALLRTGTTPVHTIIDLTDVTWLPQNLAKIREAMRVPPHPSRGWVVLIVPPHNPIIQVIGDFAGQIRSVNDQYQVVHTLHEAILLLNAHEPALALTPADST
ncbi:MAG: hypothetical protein SF162_14320 [bacterium]|nr:hypothetical protein [bacterium]